MRVLVWQWGRRGAGPRFGLHLAEGLATRPGVEPTLSLSAQAEIMQGRPANGRDLPVSTYDGLAGFARRILTASHQIATLTTRLRAIRPDAAVCAMPAPMDFIMSAALRRLTNRIIHGETGLWRRDRAKIDLLAQRLPSIGAARIDKISRIYWLIEDCKRYGTLPFAGLARAGFIAVQLLQSFVAAGVLDAEEHATFMASVDTVGSRIGHDFARLARPEFLAKYGHLRPGTYDILSPRYDEAPDLYFDWAGPRKPAGAQPRFALSVEQLRRIERLLKEHALDIDVLSLIEFIKAGIEGREYAKFVFTRSLSDALSLIRELGADYGFSVEDCAYLDYDAIRTLYSESGPVRERLAESIAQGRSRHALTRNLVLPPVIASPEEVFAFHVPPSQPNFVTRRSITAPTAQVSEPPETFAGKILFVPSADPGFDWIFTRGIAGFVTQFGGANSHMAIRAGELNIPAVIGAGEALYTLWRGANTLCLDCSNQKVAVIA